VLAATQLASLARTQQVLLAPHAFDDDRAWRRALAAELRTLFGADFALVLLAGADVPYVGDGIDQCTLAAMAAFHPASDAPEAAPDRVRYRDAALQRMHERRAAEPNPVFTRHRNEAALGVSLERTAMFDAVCRPLGIRDFHGVWAATPHGDAMLFVAHGAHVGAGTLIGDAAVPLTRVMAPALGAALELRAVERARASAVLPDAEQLVAQFALTPREAEVARAIATGLTRRQTAQALGIRESTARHHTERVFAKLGVRTRAAVALALLGGAAR
jgi:DNA-binding CsgD family transcriptional regulator